MTPSNMDEMFNNLGPAETDPVTPDNLDPDELLDGTDPDELDVEPDLTEDAPEDTPEDTDEPDVDGDEPDTDEPDSDDDEDILIPVTVDGEEYEVTAEELIAGFQFQAHNTKQAQALKAEMAKFEEYKGSVENMVMFTEQLGEQMRMDPVRVATDFGLEAVTVDPRTGKEVSLVNEVIAQLITEASVLGTLHEDYKKLFGLTPDVIDNLKREYETEKIHRENAQMKQKVAAVENTTKSVQEQRAAEMEIVAEMDSLIKENGIKLSDSKLEEFKNAIYEIAADSKTDMSLDVAYKLYKYDQSQKAAALAAKTTERMKAKKNSGIIPKSGAGDAGQKIEQTGTDAAFERAFGKL